MARKEREENVGRQSLRAATPKKFHGLPLAQRHIVPHAVPSALPLYADSFLFLYNIFGAKTLQYLHRFFAVIFIATPIFGLLSAREGYLTMIKQGFSFGHDDLIFLLKFPFTLFGVEPKMPKQGFYNDGEKVHVLLQGTVGTVLVITGLILWLGNGVIDNSIQIVCAEWKHSEVCRRR